MAVYDIIFAVLIIGLIVLYVIFSKTPDKKPEPDITAVDDIITDDAIKRATKQQNVLQETYNTWSLEEDDHRQINKSDLPWDTGIDCESEHQFDNLNAFAINNLYTPDRHRNHVLY